MYAYTQVGSDGLTALTPEERQTYIPDDKGFVAFTKSAGYSQYVNEVRLCCMSCMERVGSSVCGAWKGLADLYLS